MGDGIVKAHLGYICRRLRDLTGETSVYTPDSSVPWTLSRCANLTPRTTLDSQVSDRDFYRKEIDSKIHDLRFARLWIPAHSRLKLELLICRLQSRRNALAPIFCLPPEVLSRVFVLASYVPGVYGNYPPPLAWVKVSHICRYWSDVSRNNPLLWANIPPLSPKWTTELLERSKNLSLIVRFHQYHAYAYPPHYKSLNIALKSIERITDLSIGINHRHTHYLYLEQPAPILESFELVLNHGSSTIFPMGELFAGFAPSLRHLSLAAGCFDLKSKLFQGLTLLKLNEINIGSHMHTPEFALFLQSIPNLEELHLHGAIPDLFPDTRTLPKVEDVVHLPSLKKLVLAESPSATCANFLNHVSIGGKGDRPADNIPTLNIALPAPDHHALRLVFSRITRYCNTTKSALQSVKFSEHKLSGLLAEAWTSIDGPMMSHVEPVLSMWFRTGPLHSKLTTFVLDHFCAFLPLQGVQFVAVSNLELKPAWTAINSLPEIHTIYLGHTLPRSMLQALYNNVPVPGASSPITFIPKLRVLLFEDGFFGVEDLRTLAEILVQRRRDVGLGVIHLQFNRCRGVNKSDALSLRTLVSDVAWVEAIDDDDDDDGLPAESSDLA